MNELHQDQLDEIRKRHRRIQCNHRIAKHMYETRYECSDDIGQQWPCDAAILISIVDTLVHEAKSND